MFSSRRAGRKGEAVVAVAVVGRVTILVVLY
jgi:hypothetical protein